MTRDAGEKRSISRSWSLLLFNERKKKREKKGILTHIHTVRIVPILLSLPWERSLIKVRGWDKYAVRCILKQIPMRAALNANSF